MKKLALALLLIALRLSAQDTNAVVAAIDKAAAEDRFSGVVLLAKDGQPVMTRAWGYADAAKTTPNRIDTKFNIGSLNKFFTQVAIGQLAAAGKLALSDTIRMHLPDYPSPAADKITIQQLIDHRSGLGDTFGPGFGPSRAKLRTLADFEQIFVNEPLQFEPGTQQKYSNAGYIVLGLIIERISGQNYYDYIRDHITKPLGMSDTACYAVDENVPNMATGLTKRGPTGPLPEWRANTNTLPARGSSAGGGYSTAADLLKFANALSAGKLLPDRWTNWAFGGFDAKEHNLGIGGGAFGMNALLEIRPPYTLVILSNYDPPSAEQLWPVLRPILGIAPPKTAQDTGGVLAAVDKAAEEDRFSGVVLLAKDGQPVATKAWGYADAAKTIPNKTDTKFNLGSINKFFTKVAIGQLAAARKLSLSDTIRKHLPDYPSPAADKITIEQLVEHRSGLGDIFGPKFMASHAKLRTLADYEPLFANEPLQFEPGTSQKYSNAGYVVLGLIIEKVSGQSYYDYVRDHITKPLGMNDTASYAVDENVPNRATGLTKRGPEGPLPERRANTNTLPARGSSAGGGYSTASDLLRFANALVADKLLPERWTNWVFGDFDAKQRNLGIAGGSPGVNALVEIEPPYTLIVLSNFDPPSAEQIGQAVRPLLGVKQPERVRAGAPEPPGEILIGGPSELPMTFAGHIPIIEAKVNGKGPFRFAFDTGFAGVLMVSPDVAKQLGLNVVGETMAGDPSGKNARVVRQARVESFDAGSVHLGDFLAGIEGERPFDNADGVVGLEMFHSLLITFDYPGKKITINGGKLSAGDPHVVKYRTEKGVPNIDVDVAGTKISMDIDAGSPALLSLPLSVAKSLPLDAEPRVMGHGRTMTNEFDVYAATLKGEAHVGDITVANPQLDFVEIFPVGNIGSRFLNQYVVTFDPANKLVRFAK